MRLFAKNCGVVPDLAPVNDICSDGIAVSNKVWAAQGLWG